MLRRKFGKDEIAALRGDSGRFATFIRERNSGSIIRMLERFGRFDGSDSRELLFLLMDHENERIRALCLKNLAKIGDVSLLGFLSAWRGMMKARRFGARLCLP